MAKSPNPKAPAGSDAEVVSLASVPGSLPGGAPAADAVAAGTPPDAQAPAPAGGDMAAPIRIDAAMVDDIDQIDADAVDGLVEVIVVSPIKFEGGKLDVGDRAWMPRELVDELLGLRVVAEV